MNWDSVRAIRVLNELIDYAIDDEYNFESLKIAEVFEEAKEEEEE